MKFSVLEIDGNFESLVEKSAKSLTRISRKKKIFTWIYKMRKRMQENFNILN